MSHETNSKDSVVDIDYILRLDEPVEKLQAADRINQPEETYSDNDFTPLSKHTLTTSPWSRLGVISIPFGLGFLGIFFFLNGIFNPPNNSLPKVAESSQKSPASEKAERKDGDVYAKLALDKQALELDQINKDKQSVKSNPKPVTVAAAPPPPPVRQPTPQPVASRRYNETRPSFAPATPRRFEFNKVSNPIRTTSTVKPVDPVAEFNRLRSIGSFGAIAYTNNNLIAETSLPATQPAITQTQLGIVGDETENTTSVNTANSSIQKIRPRWRTDLKATKPLANGYLPQEDQIIQERRTKYLVVGQFASGVLVTPVIKQQVDNTRSQQANDDGQRYVAKLTQDLHDNFGRVAIEAGTLLAVKAIDVDNGSYATVQVTSIIKDNTEYPIASGAISVLGNGGKPLMARKFHHNGGTFGSDLTVGLVNGIGQVGEVLNRSDSSSSIVSSAGGTFSSNVTSNSQRNIAGAFLQGAFGSLGEVIAKRAETSTQERATRTNVWYIPQGTKVTFLVNRTLELP